MKALNRGQICSIIFICFIGNKLLTLPAILYGEIKNDGVLLTLLEFIVGFLCIWLFLECASRHPDKTMAEHLKETIGKVGYKLICLVFFIAFALKTFKLLLETEQFISSTIFKDFASINYIIPLILVCGAIAIKGLRSIGRICEAMHKPIYIGVGVIFLLTIFNITYEGVLPLFTTPISNFFNSFTRVSPWFGSYVVLFWCLGHVKIDKDFKKSALITVLTSTLIVIVFFVSFYSIFTYSSFYHRFAISEITELVVLNNSLVQLDWFAVAFWLSILVLQLTIEFYILQESFGEFFNLKRTNLFGTIFYGVLIVVLILVSVSYEAYIEFTLNNLSIPFLVFNLGIPILFLICLIRANIKVKRMATKTENAVIKKVDPLIKVSPQSKEEAT